MGYTNKTSHYELPQYVANDKPSWLGDFNAAMLKIDTVMADNDATAEAANSAATGAQAQVAALSSQLSTIQGQVNTAVDTATTADGKATTAQTVAGEANTNASEAKTLAGEAKTLAQTAKQTADNALPIGGGTMTGMLVLAGAPTADNQAATKAYVDAHSSSIAAGVETNIDLNATNTSSGSVNGRNNAVGCSITGYGVFAANISDVISAGLTFIKVANSTGNLFNLSTTASPTGDNMKNTCVSCVYYTGSTINGCEPLYAYYDGSNTVFCIATTGSASSKFGNKNFILTGFGLV